MQLVMQDKKKKFGLNQPIYFLLKKDNSLKKMRLNWYL